MINVEVERTGSESSVNLLRRFTKRVQSAGILPRLRSIRYSSRAISENVKRKKTLKHIRAKEEVTKLIKLGKMPEHHGKKRREKR